MLMLLDISLDFKLDLLLLLPNRTLGGHEMTLRLREHLIKAWEANGGADVRASPRAMSKLLKEAERLKIVLSANTEHNAQIESLLDDKDFKVLVSRLCDQRGNYIPNSVAISFNRVIFEAGKSI